MTDWHYSDNGRRLGPVTDDQLKSMFQSGGITGDTLVWNGSFGPTWKRFSEVTDLQNANTPPPLPLSSISDVWIWCLALVPVAGYFIERSVSESHGQIPAAAVFGGYFVVNCLLASRDEKLVAASGRSTKVTTFWAAALFVPFYLFARNMRLGRNQLPLAAWIASLAFAIYASAGFSMPYLGITSPGCASATSIQQVKELFPQLPFNLIAMGASDVVGISTSSSGGKTTHCLAEVVTSTGVNVGVSYTIEEQSDGYYYTLNLR